MDALYTKVASNEYSQEHNANEVPKQYIPAKTLGEIVSKDHNDCARRSLYGTCCNPVLEKDDTLEFDVWLAATLRTNATYKDAITHVCADDGVRRSCMTGRAD